MKETFVFVDKVLFYDDEKDSTFLQRYGFNHSFLGIGSNTPSCHHVKQVHGNLVVEAQKDKTDKQIAAIEADGLYSLHGNEYLGVKTADCLPVIIASKDRSFLAVIHAGWRGLAAGIVQKTIEKAQLYASQESILVLMGPCIGPQRFQVGPEVIQAFAGPSGLNSEQILLCIFKGISDRWHLDLTSLAIFFAANMGIPADNIAALRSCTYDNPDKWYSFRRKSYLDKPIWTVARRC